MAIRVTTRPLGAKAGCGLGCGLMLLIMIVFAAIGALCWPYAINTWLIYAGKTPKIVWWEGALLDFVPYFGGLSIPAAVATWLLMMFLV